MAAHETKPVEVVPEPPPPPPYRFPGITDFVAKGNIKLSFAPKIPGLYFVARAVDALSQIPTTEPENRAAMYAVADEAISALEAAVATAKAAYDEVYKNCPPLPKTKAEKAADREEEKIDKAEHVADKAAVKAAHEAEHPAKHK